MKLPVIHILFSIFLLSCVSKTNSLKSVKTLTNTEFSTTFSILKSENFYLVEVFKPWQRADNENYSYLLAKPEIQIPDSLLKVNFISIPLKSVICFSTTHIGYITALEKTETIKGVSGKDYFYNNTLRNNYNKGEVFDIGYPPSLDYETIIKIKPDLVFLYGLESSVAGIADRLYSAGIPSMLIADFLEDHPLGKAEWIKLFSLLYECEEKGDSIFNVIRNNYLNLKHLAEKAQKKPLVLTGLPWKDTWYMAGGQSFTAKFIEDAGGDYLWKTNESVDYIPLALESVYINSLKADVWINCGTATSLNDLIARDERFKQIKVVQQQNVFNNNARSNERGGNDFWESGALRADMILDDLIKIFHPGIMKNNELFYYKRLLYND